MTKSPKRDKMRFKLVPQSVNLGYHSLHRLCFELSGVESILRLQWGLQSLRPMSKSKRQRDWVLGPPQSVAACGILEAAYHRSRFDSTYVCLNVTTFWLLQVARHALRHACGGDGESVWHADLQDNLSEFVRSFATCLRVPGSAPGVPGRSDLGTGHLAANAQLPPENKP